MVNRYKVGRAYTERQRMSISGASLSSREGLSAFKAALAEINAVATVDRRIAPAVEKAEAVLRRAGLPLDPADTLYVDAQWLRQNERRTAAWYAVEILLAAAFLRVALDEGDAERAAFVALSLGELVTEAKFTAYVGSNSAKGGKNKAEEGRVVIEDQRARWREQAADIKQRNPSLSLAAIARRIDPKRWQTVRKHIIE